ncbi:hypothetical protein [Flavobacterium sp. FlaQc-50]|jgi:hypothetical protein|uniref:hypothetical protein n=1 Tax=unclassified Flavobacterium TaxID=196869 RepID=UPI0037573BB4
MTIYEKNVTATVEQNATNIMNAYGKSLPNGINFSQLIGVTFGHEIAHASLADIIHRINNPNNEEGPAIKVSNKMIDELKK